MFCHAAINRPALLWTILTVSWSGSGTVANEIEGCEDHQFWSTYRWYALHDNERYAIICKTYVNGYTLQLHSTIDYMQDNFIWKIHT